jgi:hypothetical protein
MQKSLNGAEWQLQSPAPTQAVLLPLSGVLDQWIHQARPNPVRQAYVHFIIFRYCVYPRGCLRCVGSAVGVQQHQ